MQQERRAVQAKPACSFAIRNASAAVQESDGSPQGQRHAQGAEPTQHQRQRRLGSQHRQQSHGHKHRQGH